MMTPLLIDLNHDFTEEIRKLRESELGLVAGGNGISCNTGQIGNTDTFCIIPGTTHTQVDGSSLDCIGNDPS